VRYLCPRCAPEKIPAVPLRGVLEAVFDYEEIGKRWDRHDPDWELFSCVAREFWPDVPVGGTPFHRLPRLGRELGLDRLFVKNDSLSLSGSLKDRASFLVVAEASRLKIGTIVTASTGNAACALAAVCAAAAKKAVIFVPKGAPVAKLTQLRLYGADLRIVAGSYDDAYRESLRYSLENPGLNRNTAYHPLTIEGKKTAALEIFQQNGWMVPDVIFVPTGDGVILAGIYKGFSDLKEAGLSGRIPRLVAVQAASSDAIAHLFRTGEYRPAAAPDTRADSIAVINPGNAFLAAECIRKSEGAAVLVSDREIMEAQRKLTAFSGIYAEPAAAASLAGLVKSLLDGRVSSREQIVLLVTGNGLKDVESTVSFLEGEGE
jgi:threonine synthase